MFVLNDKAMCLFFYQNINYIVYTIQKNIFYCKYLSESILSHKKFLLLFTKTN